MNGWQKSILSLLVVVLMSTLQQITVRAAPTELPRTLSISLKTNKATYHPRDEISFAETFKNCSKDSILIYDDTCYYGDDIRFKRINDGKTNWDTTSSAMHTVETGFRPSKNILLKPGEEFKRTFSAFVTDDFKVAFQRHESASFTGFTPGRKAGLDLPQKYVGCGRIYNLGQPGSYIVTVEYRNTAQWFNGEEGDKSKQPAWQGQAKSNEVSLKLEER